jgi:hypothetical protein
MAVQVLIGNQKGPLPIKASFMAPGDMPMYLEVLGSVWTTTASQMIGIQVAVDGNVIGQANIFSNGASTHRPVVPVYLPIKLNQGSHTLELTLAPGTTTTSDFNDFYTAVLHY